MRPRSRPTRLAVLALGAALLGTLAALPPNAEPAAVAPQPQEVTVVEAAVTEQLADGASTTFWVELDSEADLNRPGGAAPDPASVHAAKTEHAERSQAGLRRLLTARGAEFTPFWVSNAIQVTGDAALVAELAARPEVASIKADDVIELPAPRAAQAQPMVDSVEWNIDRINAPRVWQELGVRGEGVVVANIDSGVRYDHPALVGSYRGRNADGTFTHDYNFFDATGMCPGVPCDNVNSGHGTHTMGVMVGADGANQIGVAPGARWIAAKGCASDLGCDREHLLAAGQWILAPTDRRGANPRPDLAPDVVNNSWGGPVEDPFFADTVAAWVAAGIFPTFSNGNDGPDCVTTSSPGTLVDAYSTGALGSDDVIAPFSSRGTSLGGNPKPNISAPGVDIRSSVPTGYGLLSGTSMASPHTAGTVALMWSRSPSLQRDIAATRAVLDRTAIDVDDTSCEGTPERNNVYGEGRLDAYAAVAATTADRIGGLGGLVTADGAPASSLVVSVTGPVTRRIWTGPDGRYALGRLPVGEYTVRASTFHHEETTATVTVTEGQTVTGDLDLVRRQHATVTGTVTSSESGVPVGTTVVAVDTPVSAEVDAQGGYTLELPHGEYDLAVTSTNKCVEPATRPLTLTAATQVDFTLPERVEDFGYGCEQVEGDWIAGTRDLGISESGTRQVKIDLPFPFPLYGETHRQAWVSKDGVVAFTPYVTDDHWANGSLPEPGVGPALMPGWNAWNLTGAVRTAVVGAAPERTFVVEWQVRQGGLRSLGFAAHLHENGTVTYRYRKVNDFDPALAVDGATIGMQDGDGQVFEYSVNEAVARDGLGIRFTPGESAVVVGSVTDGNDERPVAGATVTLSSGGERVATDVTGPDGAYAAQVPPGDYDVTVTADRYGQVTGQVTAGTDTAKFDVSLSTARVTAPERVLVVVPAGEDRQRSLTIGNTGTTGAAYTVSEDTDVPWLRVVTPDGTVEPGATRTAGLTVHTGGLAAGSVHSADLVVTSGSGRAPSITVPVTVVVPGYTAAIDSGARSSTVDSLGDQWLSDRAHTAGSFGHVGRARTESTRDDIAGTDDAPRFQSLLSGMDKYQFDGVVDGLYTVELDFAELQEVDPNEHLFDVVVEGVKVLPALDIADAVGTRAALRFSFPVRVTDGSVDVQFVQRAGFGRPTVNAIRVTHRPDLG